MCVSQCPAVGQAVAFVGLRLSEFDFGYQAFVSHHRVRGDVGIYKPLDARQSQRSNAHSPLALKRLPGPGWTAAACVNRRWWCRRCEDIEKLDVLQSNSVEIPGHTFRTLALSILVNGVAMPNAGVTLSSDRTRKRRQNYGTLEGEGKLGMG
jgi:hypothetical protein